MRLIINQDSSFEKSAVALRYAMNRLHEAKRDFVIQGFIGGRLVSTVRMLKGMQINTLIMFGLFDESLHRSTGSAVGRGAYQPGDNSKLAALLKDGIGDTIRVSLTENPVNELPVARTIADYFYKGEYKGNWILQNNNPVVHYECESWDEFIVKASCDFGPFLLDKKIDDFSVTANINGVAATVEQIDDFKDNLQQAARRKFTKPEYIACPGCGRTLYNLEETFNEVKRRTAHLKGVRIAIMGCIVNGPGEMADADFGYVGEGKGKVCIYKGKEPVMRSVPQEEAIEALLKVIEENI